MRKILRRNESLTDGPPAWTKKVYPSRRNAHFQSSTACCRHGQI